MNKSEHKEHYYAEKNRIANFLMESQFERDKTIIQISGICITILAGFGEEVLTSNRHLSTWVISLFGVTIFLQMIGFVTTMKGFGRVSKNMDRNVLEGRQFFDPDYTSSPWTKVNTALNYLSVSGFLVGFILLAILIIYSVWR